MTDLQMIPTRSSYTCRPMPIEPNAWYAIRMMHYEDDPDVRPEFEYAMIRRGAQIAELHRLMDFSMNTGLVRVLMWIERLTDDEARELGI